MPFAHGVLEAASRLYDMPAVGASRSPPFTLLYADDLKSLLAEQALDTVASRKVKRADGHEGRPRHLEQLSDLAGPSTVSIDDHGLIDGGTAGLRRLQRNLRNPFDVAPHPGIRQSPQLRGRLIKVSSVFRRKTSCPSSGKPASLRTWSAGVSRP